jgi:hypothetical protein
MVYAINVKTCFLETWIKGAGVFGYFPNALVSLPKDLSISDHPGLTVQP